MRRYDPELAAVAPDLPPSDLTDPAGARARNRERHAVDPGYPGRHRLAIAEHRIPGPAGDVPVRIYRPKDATGPLPAVLWLHGGSFMLGDLDASDGVCAEIADRAGAVVVNVDYRLAPEHPCPAGLEDCDAALRWLADDTGRLGVDRERIAIAGSSAGGCLAAGVALMARDRGWPRPAGQVLLYPVLDDRAATGSARSMVDVPVFTAESNRVMWRSYLAGAAADGYRAPARAADLTGLPPTYLLLAEHDPLRDEGLDYAARLLAAGVPVDLRLAAGTFHGFDSVAPATAIARRERAAYVAALAALLARVEDAPCVRP